MIKLKKDIKRECEFTFVNHKGKPRPVIVTLSPGDILKLRPKGTQREVEVTLNHCMVLADIIDAERRYKKAKEDYKIGKRKRKPKKAYFPYSRVFFKALK